MDTYQSIASVLGILGFGVGVLSVWLNLNRDRVKLVVKPILATSEGIGEPETLIGVDVLNLSSFPVVVAEVGFVEEGTQRRLPIRASVFTPGAPLPRKIDATDSLTLYPPFEHLDPALMARARGAYVRTGHGKYFEGTSAVLQGIREIAASVGRTLR